MDYELLDVEKYESERGTILNFLRGDSIKEHELGQIYVMNILPGQTRGNHYHKVKQEWVLVIGGTLEIKLEDSATGEAETIVLEASYESPKKLRIGPYIVHSFINRQDTVISFLEYSTRMYDPADDDIYKA